MKKEIEIPEGYEIDQLTFKKIEKKLPKMWKELGRIEGYYIDNDSYIRIADASCYPSNKNIFPTKELAEASLALAQLLQLREAYNDGWVADWSDNKSEKYTIEVYDNELNKDYYYDSNKVMNFKTAELRDEFLKNFKDLLTIAKPLL